MSVSRNNARGKSRLVYLLGALGAVIIGAVAIGGVWLRDRYAVCDTMLIPVKEYASAEYPEDPADKSINYGRYSDRRLKLVKRDATHIDFIFEPKLAHVATVAFKDIDVSLMTPSEPFWTKRNSNLERIALTDRQWNRQQVIYPRGSSHLKVTGGDGFERDNLAEADLAKNCLNAGLWEVLLFDREDGEKKLYYHGWFTFPLGYYKEIFARNTGVSYWKHWRQLEHWSDPAGIKVNLGGLRTVLRERTVAAKFLAGEPIFAYGEQRQKLRMIAPGNLLTWGNFFAPAADRLRFATFAPPGRYFVSKPWKNEYWRLAKFDKAILRDIKSPAADRPLLEIELDFTNRKTGGPTRLIVSGLDPQTIPQLDISKYPKGLYVVMGIGVPPVFQSYRDLEENPPDKSPYFSVMLDGQDRWINHHAAAIDGVILHKDKINPEVLHWYLLSYERESLIGHFVIALTDKSSLSQRERTLEDLAHTRE